MERKIKKVIMDLQFLMNYGQISVDLTDFRYQKMLCGALDASGKKYKLGYKRGIKNENWCIKMDVS